MGKREKRERRNAERKALRDRAEAKRLEDRRTEFRTRIAANPCPKCGSSRSSIFVYGFLDMGHTQMKEDLAAGYITPGGCCFVSEDGDGFDASRGWFCRTCRHEWGEVQRLP